MVRGVGTAGKVRSTHIKHSPLSVDSNFFSHHAALLRVSKRNDTLTVPAMYCSRYRSTQKCSGEYISSMSEIMFY